MQNGFYFTLLLKMSLKELEHRKLGWNVLILKYDLGKSLSKETGRLLPLIAFFGEVKYVFNE